ncbi:hypothetical protein AAG906_019724 [Vitis piasezkii]
MKDGRTLQKQGREKNQGSRALDFKVRKFHTDFKVRKFRHPKTKVRNPRTKGSNFHTPQFQGAKSISSPSSKDSPRTTEKPRNPEQSPTSISAMAKTERGLPPPHPHRHLDHIEPPWEAQLHHCSGPTISPSEGNPSRRYPTGGHPRTCATSRSSRELCFRPPREPSSRVPESHPTHLGQSHLERTLGSVDIPPETVIRRPMIAGPPIEGNLDCDIDPSTRDLL